MKYPTRLASAALIGALALGGVACGGGDTETEDTGVTEESPAEDGGGAESPMEEMT